MNGKRIAIGANNVRGMKDKEWALTNLIDTHKLDTLVLSATLLPAHKSLFKG